MVIMPCFYFPSSLLVQKISDGIERRAIIITALFLFFFAFLADGPSLIFNFPNTIWMMAIGQMLHGILLPFIMVPSLPEMIDSVSPFYDESAFTKINDLSSGIFTMFIGIGQVIAPIIGSYINEGYGF